MEEEIGKITHYFPKINVGVIELDQGELHVGDTIHIKGHTTDFYQKVDSMQIEHQSSQSIKKDESAGLKVDNPVREHDLVLLVKES